MVRRIVDTVQPVTNALPGGAPGSIDLAVPPVKGRWLLGSGGRGRFGHDRPARWAAYASEPLPRGTRVTRVVALDANGRVVAESERDEIISHPVCHVFR